MHKTKHLVFIVGPTAVGKTAVGVALAKQYGTAVISCDSRQIYKEMSIGTAKPTLEEMDGVPHLFVDSHTIFERYTAGMFERDAMKELEALFKKHDVVFAVGGSGLYVNSLAFGIEDIPFDQAIRDKINERFEKEGLEVLTEELNKVDPNYAAVADLKNPRRVKRALEVYHTTGKPFSEWGSNKKERPFKIHWIGMELTREELFERIHLRIDQMIEAGLLEENKSLFKYKGEKALQTVGYQEIFKHLSGDINLEEAIRLVKRNTRVFAKKQITWFKKIEDVNWYKPSHLSQIKENLEHNLLQ